MKVIELQLTEPWIMSGRIEESPAVLLVRDQWGRKFTTAIPDGALAYEVLGYEVYQSRVKVRFDRADGKAMIVDLALDEEIET